VAVAESKEEVLEKINKDVYATSGVWNLDEASMIVVEDEQYTNSGALDTDIPLQMCHSEAAIVARRM